VTVSDNKIVLIHLLALFFYFSRYLCASWKKSTKTTFPQWGSRCCAWLKKARL